MTLSRDRVEEGPEGDDGDMSLTKRLLGDKWMPNQSSPFLSSLSLLSQKEPSIVSKFLG